MELFYKLYENLHRLGPGSVEDTLFAFSKIKANQKNLSVLDLGCGTGASTLVLSEIIEGEIIAIDNHQPFLDFLISKYNEIPQKAKLNCICLDMNNINFAENKFNLIWAEGSIYNIGFENGLKKIFPFLKKDGFVVFSEMNYFQCDTP